MRETRSSALAADACPTLTTPAVCDAVARFRALCDAFYNDGDHLARAVLHAFEVCTVAHSGQEDEAVIVRAEPYDGVDAAAVQSVLHELGVSSDGGALPVAVFRQFLQAKNKAREDYHKRVEHEQFVKLNELIRSALQEQATVSEISERQYSKQRLAGLRRFVKDHQRNVGSHAFLRGLRRALLTQQKCSTVMAWRFDDAVLTQSGSAFMHAAVGLLIETLLFTCDDAPRMEGGERTWRVCRWLAAKELQTLADCICEDDLVGRATGTLETTADARTTAENSNSTTLLAGALARPADMLRQTLKAQQPRFAVASDHMLRWAQGRGGGIAGVDWFTAKRAASAE